MNTNSEDSDLPELDEEERIKQFRRPGWGSGPDSDDSGNRVVLIAAAGLLLALFLASIPLVVLSSRAPVVTDPVVDQLIDYGQAIAAGEDPEVGTELGIALTQALREDRPDGTTVLFVPGEVECWALVIGGEYQAPLRAPGRC